MGSTADMTCCDPSAASQGILHMGAQLTANVSTQLILLSHPPRATVTKVRDNFQTSQCYVKAFHLQPSCLSTVWTWFLAAEGYDGVMISAKIWQFC